MNTLEDTEKPIERPIAGNLAMQERQTTSLMQAISVVGKQISRVEEALQVSTVEYLYLYISGMYYILYGITDYIFQD